MVIAWPYLGSWPCEMLKCACSRAVFCSCPNSFTKPDFWNLLDMFSMSFCRAPLAVQAFEFMSTTLQQNRPSVATGHHLHPPAGRERCIKPGFTAPWHIYFLSGNFFCPIVNYRLYCVYIYMNRKLGPTTFIRFTSCKGPTHTHARTQGLRFQWQSGVLLSARHLVNSKRSGIAPKQM